MYGNGCLKKWMEFFFLGSFENRYRYFGGGLNVILFRSRRENGGDDFVLVVLVILYCFVINKES